MGAPRGDRQSRPRGSPELDLPSNAPRLVLGLQAVRAAIRAHGSRLGAVLVEDLERPRLAAVARFARDNGVLRVERAERRVLDRLAGGVMHQGVAALAPELVLAPLESLFGRPDLLVLALDKIQDPQNFGAVIRSAVGLGASGLVWGEHASAPLGPATLRAAAGAAELATLCRVPSLPGALDQARRAGAQVIGLDPGAARELRELDLRGPTVIVIGNEHDGLSPAVRRQCSDLTCLVPKSPVESLNASTAAAIALYQCVLSRIKSNI